jgi:pyruvate/2-oxoglutarate dehydrogenase complex dihydrolipoamide dehydrogenase (E3) component
MLEVDMVLYSGGRDANSEKIGCENVGVKVAALLLNTC